MNNMYYETRLKDIREELEISQQEIAKTLNVSRQNYSFWETGYKFIPLKHLNNFCNIYKCSMDYILKLSDNNNYIFYNLDKKKIGKIIKEIRANNNLTQVELANFLNTTHSTISAVKL